MSIGRKLILSNDEVYHVFNRGVEKRPIFTNKWELDRALLTLNFYRFANLPIKLSKFLVLPKEQQERLKLQIEKECGKLVEIICYCLMPNHFHLMLKQKAENGISIFISNIANSYTRYFNTKHERIGPLFQGIFKAVRIESDEQLVHVSRYIHLNPVSSFLIKPEVLESYQWSSYPEFIGILDRNFLIKEDVLGLFPSKEKYAQFVLDQVDYARQLEMIKHLALE
ncbi:transposase [Candidatus Daviesbacteria bacterium]|nr:transposase [Candidatus Daviesbacteria bacterium]